MKSPPKRTRTQAGLGQVKAPLERREDDDDVQLINAPPPSSRNLEGPTPRHTRAIESQRRPSREQELAEPERVESKPPQSAPISKPPVSKPASSPPLDRSERDEGQAKRVRSSADRRTIDERSLTARTGRMSHRPPASGKPASRRARGNSLAPPRKADAATVTARSKRPSIREDHVGTVKPASASTASGRVPKVLKTKAEIAEAPIDHRAGFLLAHIDGTISVQALVDIAGMPEEDVHEILERLRRLGIIAFR